MMPGVRLRKQGSPGSLSDGSGLDDWVYVQAPTNMEAKASGEGKGGVRRRCRSWASNLAPGDGRSIALLLVLYTLQGVPMGLSASVPFLLTDKVSYGQQALFSLVSLPFSFKLLWAPIVDSTALRTLNLGRRKSWLLPVQALCGLLMLAAAPIVGVWMGEGAGSKPDVAALTWYFLGLYLLMATQDIAVDGWALTMLSKGNVGMASTCNSIGQTLGFFLAHVGFLALNSPETCNRFLRSTPSSQGLVSLGGFLWFWGWVFLSTTVLVAMKHEDPDEGLDEQAEEMQALAAPESSPGRPRVPRRRDACGVCCLILNTYRQLLQILLLPNVRSLCLLLLTIKVGFAVTESATNLKLVEYGMPAEEIALISPLMVLLGVAVPVALSKLTSGPRPLDALLSAYGPRLCVGLLYGALLPLARWAYAVPGLAPASFRLLFLLTVGLREVASNAMFVSQMAFFARVSDPSIGGTYMTLLNTVSNLGGSWVKTVSLALLDRLTLRECVGAGGLAVPGVACEGPAQAAQRMCAEVGGRCVLRVDGYHVQLGVCTTLGVAWLLVAKKVMARLQEARPEEWCIQPPRAAAKAS